MTDDLILEHYRKEAEALGSDAGSTMHDLTVREMEVDALTRCVAALVPESGHLLEIGCGNGYFLKTVREKFSGLSLTGMDFSPEMVSLAEKRRINGARVCREDVRALSFSDSEFDAVVSERCLINLLSEKEQGAALAEINRVLKPGGHLILLEAFTDAHEELSKARQEVGLEPTAMPYHNRWFDKEWFEREAGKLFEILPDLGRTTLPPKNFLSSHYFISRVLYPAVTSKPVVHNTAFVKFFRFLPPQGNFSPIQLYLLRKRK